MTKQEHKTLEVIVGETYLFQTCTKDWIGRVCKINGPFSVVLEEASWVADSGRFHIFIHDGKVDGMEIEPVGIVGLQWVNWIPWPHKLPKEAV